MRNRGICLIVMSILLAGCATAVGRGEVALRAGRYDEATSQFQLALARDPGRVDALAGLGIAEYKRGEFARATAALRHVVAEAPNAPDVRLYLGLGYLSQDDLGHAREQLAALRGLGPHPRLRSQLDRALELLQPDLPIGVRAFISASLEHELEWEQDVNAARRAPRTRLEPTWLIEWDGHDWNVPRYPSPRGAP